MSNFNPTPEPTILDALKHEVAVWLASVCPSPVPSLESIAAALEWPKNDTHGDCSLPLPKLRLPGVNPKSLASDLVAKFQPSGNLLNVAAKDTFLNFYWNKKAIVNQVLPQILAQGSQYGTNKSGGGRTVLVEFGSPNIAKPFHAGHLRSAIVGNFIKHTYRANGFNVIGINYLGDWGKQYGLLAVGFLKYGDSEEMKKDAIRHLFSVYVKINQDADNDPSIHDEARAYFKRMEDGDATALALWKQFRDLSIVKYKQVYARLNIEHEVYSGESFYESGMKEAVRVLKEQNLMTESNNAQVVDLKPYNLDTAIVLKSDGASLYLTRDLAAAKGRYDEYHFFKSFYVIGSPQDHYMKQLFKILDLMGYPWAKDCVHINYGMVRGMSTRKGTVVFLEDILDEAQRVMHDVMKSNEAKYALVEDPVRVSDILAVSAVVIQDFSAKRIKDYDFNMSRMTSFEGDTGPYLQYAHARLCSIERKFEAAYPNARLDTSVDYALLTEDAALSLASILAKYPTLVVDACRTEEPCLVTTYLFHLCHQLSGVIEALYVLGQPEPVATARMALFKAVRVTLGNGLTLLGLQPLSRM